MQRNDPQDKPARAWKLAGPARMWRCACQPGRESPLRKQLAEVRRV